MSKGTQGPGSFYVLDGIDGCGKSTQAMLLFEHLKQTGREAVHLREPGSTRVGERIRALLLDPEIELNRGTETLLFAAARHEMLARCVVPSLAAGQDVVCERFNSSTFAYQAVARGLDEGAVLELLHGWSGKPAPDRILILDVDPGEAERRCRARGSLVDRIEAEGIDFQRRVAEGFRRYAELDSCAVLIDGSGSADAVAARVLEECNA